MIIPRGEIRGGKNITFEFEGIWFLKLLQKPSFEPRFYKYICISSRVCDVILLVRYIYIIAAAQVDVVIVFRSKADRVVSGEGGIVGLDIDQLLDLFCSEANSQLGMHEAKG
jgi:hypothetical protein